MFKGLTCGAILGLVGVVMLTLLYDGDIDRAIDDMLFFSMVTMLVSLPLIVAILVITRKDL
ncbi:MAG: hypothetical protein A2Y75_05325 [Candidatus Solincola sediminis]|uniref:Uncharacterized protein n=1 Tax=Candidatus Solincola sediminis TaxID=1797199 RepID=A0A1F2WGC0_9ACTN|nr:MAG: hypothetical protein A2Y75_05325 [Candidatus Solincola sediminis]